jgi:DHA1 family tetracycline resistance protein-like MFS transporter
MGIGFVTVAAISRWAIADSTVGLYTAAFLIGQTIGNLILGLVADKVGHKLPLEIAAIGSALAFSVAWLGQLPDLYFLVFILLGMVEGATIVSGTAIVMEFAAPEKRPTYAGLTNTSIGVVSMIGPMIGAVLALLGYNRLFMVSVIMSILAFITFHWWVKEPRLSQPIQEPGD